MTARPLCALLALLAFPLPAAGQDITSDWNALLPELVAADGGVRYARLATDLEAPFDDLRHALREVSPSNLATDRQRLAFWINAYNILFLERVRAAGVPDDIEAHGFEAFFEAPVRVAGQYLTLDQIEHVILRRQPGPAAVERLAVSKVDPRIHVALNCGAVSCPRLRTTAFTEENLDRELDAAMREFVNSERHFRKVGGEWFVSSLLEWFAEDWDLHAPAGDYLARFVDDGRTSSADLKMLLVGRSAVEIVRQPGVRVHYDWMLNEAR